MQSKVSSSVQKHSYNPLIRNSCMSSYQLAKLNRKLDMERINTVHDHQQIKKSKKNTKQTNYQFIKKIKQIQQEAAQLARRLQQEKTKNQQLQILVKNTQAMLYEQKLKKYQDVMNKKQSDQFQLLKHTQQNVQKKLQKIIQRTNTSQFQISQKINTINSLRRQRSLHSSLFDKIQQQLYDIQFYYKELLIQRKLKQKQYLIVNHKFNKLEQESHENYQKSINEKILQQDNNNSSSREYISSSRSAYIEDLSERKRADQRHLTSTSKNKKLLTNKTIKKTVKQLNRTNNNNIDINQQQIKKIQYQKNIISILHDFHCDTIQQLYAKNIKQNVEQTTINKIYQQSNHIQQLIQKQEQQIKRLQKQLKSRNNIEDHNNYLKNLNKKKQIYEYHQQGQSVKAQIINFKMDFLNLFTNTAGLKSTKNIQSQSNNLYENKQQLKYFIDNFTTFYKNPYTTMHNIDFTAKSTRRRGNIKKSRLLLSPNNKNTSTNFNKAPSLQSQTNNNNNNTTVNINKRNSLKLDDILFMNKKPQQYGKSDRNQFSIMTEEELMEESRKIMKMTKKKSQFIFAHKNKQ